MSLRKSCGFRPYTLTILLTILAPLFFTTGCTQMFGARGMTALFNVGSDFPDEERAMTRFISAIEDKDVDKLREATSSRFHTLALRREEALEDLKILSLPTGDVTVFSVGDDSEKEKLVSYQIGERMKRLLCVLKFDEAKEEWVVDDVFVKQKQKGLEATRSVTEQLDLLATVRDFVDRWDESKKSEIVLYCAPELKSALAQLPDAHVTQLSQQSHGTTKRKTKARLNAQLNGQSAVVRFPRSSGQMTLTLEMLEGEWKISDLAVESLGHAKHIQSLKKSSQILNAGLTFLASYATEDRDTLQTLCTDHFFNGGLAYGDYKSVMLPKPEDASQTYDIKQAGEAANMLVQRGDDYVKLDLIRNSIDASQGSGQPYLIKNVTIYELNGHQNKSLSSIFTSRSIARLYAEAIADNDISRLKKMSTSDFNNRVWDHVDKNLMTQLPVAELGQSGITVISEDFEGALTRLSVQQGNNHLVYLLRDRDGQVRVDDILQSNPERPESVKAMLEYVLPIKYFVYALENGSFEGCSSISSYDFNRLIWQQVEQIPIETFQSLLPLKAPLHHVEVGKEQIVVFLGHRQPEAKVTIVVEHTRHLIEEIELVDSASNQQIALKDKMRVMMAEGTLVKRKRFGSAEFTGSEAPIRLAGRNPESGDIRSEVRLSRPEAEMPTQTAQAVESRTALRTQPRSSVVHTGVEHASYSEPADTDDESAEFDEGFSIEPADDAFTTPVDHGEFSE